jgi:hypothetical protein
LKVPSKNGSASGEQRDDDVLSDVVMDDSRNVSAAPSRQVRLSYCLLLGGVGSVRSSRRDRQTYNLAKNGADCIRLRSYQRILHSLNHSNGPFTIPHRPL